MANTFLTPSIVAREALMILENELVASNLFYRGYTSEFTVAKVGDTISIRRPASFTAQEFTGSTTNQDGTESSVNLKLEKHLDVTFSVTSKEATLSLNDLSEQLIKPAVVALAQGVDEYILSKYVDVYHFVGTAGDPADSLADLAQLNRKLHEMKVPNDGRRFDLVDPIAEADLNSIDAVITADKRGDGGDALVRAEVGFVMNMSHFMSQNVPYHTAGTASGAVVNGAVAEGAQSMAVDGAAGTETLLTGDVFTVAGVDGEFVVTADATATAGAFASVAFAPAAPAGGFANDAVITLVGSHTANLIGHPNAIATAIVPLEAPLGAEEAKAAYLNDRGLGIRVVFDYNSNSKTSTVSLDLLVGAAVIDGELIARHLG